MRDSEDKPVDRIRVFVFGDENPRGYLAKLVGSDKSTDLAVIKFDAGRTLASAQLGDSDAMRVGDWVLAIGSPFGLDSTVTAGIISAKTRDIEGGQKGQFKRFLQTDAAINPGNSGGPLVNLAGQVIGINTAIATRRGTYDGVGFAMPSNTARKVYNSIISTGTVRRGAIGVQVLNQTNPALLRSFGAEHGVVVNSVEPGSPAERAGLKIGDVILAVDGKPVSGGDQLVSMVSDSEIGKKLNLDILRDRKRISTTVEVGDRNKIVSEARGAPVEPGGTQPGEESQGGALGVSVRGLTHDQAEKLGDKLHLGSPQGVRVTDVKPDSFAEELGIEPGDIVLSINHQTVASVEEFNRLQGQLKSGMDVLMLVARQNEGTYTTLFLADRLP
jgi:serine protease Do